MCCKETQICYILLFYVHLLTCLITFFQERWKFSEINNLWILLGYCKYTTAGNISYCASDFWIFYYKIPTSCTFKIFKSFGIVINLFRMLNCYILMYQCLLRLVKE